MGWHKKDAHPSGVTKSSAAGQKAEDMKNPFILWVSALFQFAEFSGEAWKNHRQNKVGLRSLNWRNPPRISSNDFMLLRYCVALMCM